MGIDQNTPAPNAESFKTGTGVLLSPKKAAKVLGVSESSVKRWCDAGHLQVVKTSGGHRRISVQTLMTFARSKGHALQNPQLIDMPALRPNVTADKQETLLPRLNKFLAEGIEDSARSILVSSWMSGKPLSHIFDTLVGPAFATIGHQWEANEIEIYEERRACLIVERSFADMRRLVGPSKPGAPGAIGCTLEGDPYSLPTAMCELTLRELGWDAQNLGAWQPIESMSQAVKKLKPRLFWLSVSKIDCEDVFLNTLRELSHVTESNDCALILGGRALWDPNFRKKIEFSGYCDSMKQLSNLARQIHDFSK
ncbi:MAG: helix-turn-helix domain-containing protein [Deltaproteobacteria bacterium]|jgi:MerR family transcriptional regulator, light-induced transcriptional regulator|nr:helix-turn-helix domain-containing protein [Deltaproteobacteria bacterium]MBT6434334.1 helix-turn-helix domain-containing protein [Deltaproteobacteria bacterium]MBT6492580.1 helix-turn-helix domain-containing protein [Deltaproteobacteria bacterium]